MSLVKRALVSLWKRNRATIAGGTRADSRFASSQWETALLSNDVSHWLGASIVSAVCCSDNPWFYYTFYANTITPITLCQTRCNIFLCYQSFARGFIGQMFNNLCWFYFIIKTLKKPRDSFRFPIFNNDNNTWPSFFNHICYVLNFLSIISSVPWFSKLAFNLPNKACLWLIYRSYFYPILRGLTAYILRMPYSMYLCPHCGTLSHRWVSARKT